MKKEIIYKLLKSSSPDDIRLGMEFACKYLTFWELQELSEKDNSWYSRSKRGDFLYFILEDGGCFIFNSVTYFAFVKEHLRIIETNKNYININPENTRLNNKNLQI